MILEPNIGINVQTTDAVSQVLFSKETANNMYYKVSGTVIGLKDDGSQVISGEINGIYIKDSGGTLTAVVEVPTLNKTGGFGATDISITNDGNNILINVTGLAGTTINWDCNLDVLISD